MKTIEECRSALDRLAAHLDRADDRVRRAAGLDRSLSCRITDLDTTFVGRLVGSRLVGLRAVPGTPARRADIRLAMTGDDLVALVDGKLHFAKAWGSGRITLHAGFRDLLRLRSLL